VSDDRLALTITNPDGTSNQWGATERDAADIPADTTFGTSIAGGFKTASNSLLRDQVVRPDEGLFRDVRIHGAGGETAWEGRINQLPRDGRSLQPGAVGWSAHLADDPSFMEVYVDADTTHWTDPPLSQLAAIASSGYSVAELQWQVVNGGLVVAYPSQALPAKTLGESFRTPRLVTLAYAQYKGANTTLPAGYGVNLADGPSGASYPLTLDNTLRTTAFTTPGPSPLLYAISPGSAVTPASGSQTRLAQLAMFGAHGLAPQDPGASDTWGFLISDIVADVVKRTAPLLKFTTGATGSIPPTSFVLRQAAFHEPGTGADAIAFLNGYELRDWGVWDNREFRYTPQDRTSNVWDASAGRDAKWSLEGDQGDLMVNGIVVTFTDLNGDQQIVGPPGTTGATATSTALLDTSPANPVNMAGIPRKWALLPLSIPTWAGGAIQIGTVALAEMLLATRRGSVVLTGPQRRVGESAWQPAWKIRAGDNVTDSTVFGSPVRRIIETSYAHRGRQITCTLDNSSHTLDAIVERLGTGLIGRWA